MSKLKNLAHHNVIMVVGIIFIIFSSNIGHSQNKTLLDLEDAIDIALEQSYQMKSLRLSLVEAEKNLHAAKSRFRTNADFEFDVPNWNETVSEIPVQNSLPVFNTTGIVRYQSTFDINQPLPTSGFFRLRSQAYHRKVSTFRADLEQDIRRKEIYTSVRLSFFQPLFTINQLKLGLKNANLNYERTSRRYKRTQLDIVYDVTFSFFNFYRATQQSKIAEDDYQQQQELFDLAQKKFSAGLIPEVEVLQMEVDLAESKNYFFEAGGNLTRAEDSFKQLIGLDFNDQIGVQTSFEYTTFEVELDFAITKALANRSEIREGEIEVELSEINVKEVDARSEIRGDIQAFYDITGISDPNLPFNSTPERLWESSIEDLQRRPKNRGVVFTLSVPVWDWGVNDAEVAAAKARLKENELQLDEQRKTIVREVREVVGRIKEAENRLDVLQKHQEVAQKTFDISLQRFNNGDITAQVLALDRDRLVQAKFSYLTAYIDYKLSAADLKRKTMWDYEKNQSLID